MPGEDRRGLLGDLSTDFDRSLKLEDDDKVLSYDLDLSLRLAGEHDLELHDLSTDDLEGVDDKGMSFLDDSGVL